MASLRSWVSDNKFATAGTLSASAIGAMAIRRKRQPVGGGGRLILSSRFGRVLTVAAIAGWAVKHYYFDVKRAMGDGDVYPAEWSEISGSADSEERWSW